MGEADAHKPGLVVGDGGPHRSRQGRAWSARSPASTSTGLPEEKARGDHRLPRLHPPAPARRAAGLVRGRARPRAPDPHDGRRGDGGSTPSCSSCPPSTGAMPQTREHLAILDLLGVDRGVIALTMADLVDEELADLAEEDVRSAVAGTPLSEAPIVRFSSVTGQGKEALIDAIGAIAPPDRGRARSDPFRLPVDRLFVRPGFGVVVTGTAWVGAGRGRADRLAAARGGDRAGPRDRGPRGQGGGGRPGVADGAQPVGRRSGPGAPRAHRRARCGADGPDDRRALPAPARQRSAARRRFGARAARYDRAIRAAAPGPVRERTKRERKRERT